MSGEILWTPPADIRQTAQIGRYLDWLAATRGLEFADYDALHAWSVGDLAGFWSSIWEYCGVKAEPSYERPLGSTHMPGAEWFPGARLNYAENLLLAAGDGDRVVALARSQTREPSELTAEALRDQVARARVGLMRLGVRAGDRVAAYLPNIPETFVAFLATVSLGAIWASCAPEFGARAVVSRFAQIEPKVMLAVGGYTYREREIDRRREVAAIRRALPRNPVLVHVPYGPYGPRGLPDAIGWDDLLRTSAPLHFERVPFDHPLHVLFSSGTTGLPKAIVHGHGGILLEHMKAHSLGLDVRPGDRLLWFTTTSWMMWSFQSSAVLSGASAIMIDGDPNWPGLDAQWRLAAETGATHLGISPALLMNCRKAGLRPGAEFDLSALRVVATAGSPLPAAGARYVYEQLGPQIILSDGSGGTDMCAGILGHSPLQPVYAGEISGPLLGVAAKAFDDDGNQVVGKPGELVITAPMPSMPVKFWDDPAGARLHASYFARYPDVWAHGDWALFTERGSCMILGRSDATLNRGGVRLGTAELYAVAEEFPEIADSLAIHLDDGEGGVGKLLLFVALTPGEVLDDGLRRKIAAAFRDELSPRHVPDAIVAVPAIPRTHTGKKLETPVKRILQGAHPDDVVSRAALADPSAIDAFLDIAAGNRQVNDHDGEPMAENR
jgi:acetoacetyl-CoA synthetase